VVKRRRGRPRKSGQRYRSGKLKITHENPLTTARQQPHRKGLGDRVLDQRAESALGRMALREELSDLQLLAAVRYAQLWRVYLATLGGPSWPWRGQGRAVVCDGCPSARSRKDCACERARSSWRRCWDRLTYVGCAALVTQVACYDMVCPPEHFMLFCTGLDALALELGLTNHRKRDYRYASSKNRSPPHS
jgi:hypothetical protein